MTVQAVSAPRPSDLSGPGGRATTGGDAAAEGFGAFLAQHLTAHQVAGQSADPESQTGQDDLGALLEQVDQEASAGAAEAAADEVAEEQPQPGVTGDGVQLLVVPGALVTATTPAPGGAGAAQGSGQGTGLPGADAEGQGQTPGVPTQLGTAAQSAEDQAATAPGTRGTAEAAGRVAESLPGSGAATGQSAETTPVHATATVSGASAAAPTAASPAPGGNPVTAQVFPTIPALVSRGEGTHSLMLRLHPADLGEVHVTISVKDGAVDVTLAAGREAQQALRNGAGELRSLLELAGATGGQLVVRDLPSGSAPAPAGANAFGLPTDSADAHGASADGSRDEGSSDERSTSRGHAGGGDPDPAAQPTTNRPTGSRPSAGIDLSL